MSHRFNSNGSLLILILALCLGAGGLAAPAPAAEIIFVDDTHFTLDIGDDLYISLGPALDGKPHRIVLEDDVGFVVAESWVVEPESKVLLWQSTGVIGCDGGAVPAADSYLYARIEDAEAALKGRTFYLTAFDAKGFEEAEMKFTVEVTRDGYAFFSDASGCPRCEFAYSEPIYFARYGSFQEPWWLFLVDSPPPVGDPITELRGEFQVFPQLIAVDGFDVYTEQVSPGCQLDAVNHWALTRPSSEAPDYKRMPGDLLFDKKFCPPEPPADDSLDPGFEKVIVRPWDENDDHGAECPPP